LSSTPTGVNEYRKATAGLNIKAIYMEVDVAPEDLHKEADEMVALCRTKSTATVAATIGGRPDAPDFENYVRRYAKNVPEIKGVRRSTRHIYSRRILFKINPSYAAFKRSVHTALIFELTMRPKELMDAAKLIRLCPETRFAFRSLRDRGP